MIPTYGPYPYPWTTYFVLLPPSECLTMPCTGSHPLMRSPILSVTSSFVRYLVSAMSLFWSIQYSFQLCSVTSIPWTRLVPSLFLALPGIRVTLSPGTMFSTHCSPLWWYLPLLIWVRTARRLSTRISLKASLPCMQTQLSALAVCQQRSPIFGGIASCVAQRCRIYACSEPGPL